jgi:hypothetical protein
MVSTLSEVRMTAATQFGAGSGPLAAAEPTLLPKRNILVPKAEGLATSSASARTHVAWPILVIGLGAILTLVWLIFLVWEAITVVTLVM